MTQFSSIRTVWGRALSAMTAGLTAFSLAGPVWGQTPSSDSASTETKKAESSGDSKQSADQASKDTDAKKTAKDAKTTSDKSGDAKKSTTDSANSSKSNNQSSTTATKSSSSTAKDNGKDGTKDSTAAKQDDASVKKSGSKSIDSRDNSKDKTSKEKSTTARDDSGNAKRDRQPQDASRSFRDFTEKAQDRRDATRRDVSELRDDRDQAGSRDRDSQPSDDVPRSRDVDIDRDADIDRDIDVERRDVDVNREVRKSRDRDIDVDRDSRDRRDVRDTDRRDSRVDVRTRTDRRNVARSRIDNFRADSVTARELGVTFGGSSNRGLVIENIARNAVLADLNLRRGDVIVAVDDRRVTSQEQFVQFLFAEEVRNETVTVVVLRDGREVPIEVRPAMIIEEILLVQEDVDPLRRFGVVVDDRVPDQVVVVRVIPDSPAFAAGIRPGDVIVTFSGTSLRGPQQFVQVLERVEPGQLALEVNRARRVQELQVQMPEWQRHTVARPDLDVDRPAVERREDRRDTRVERRQERRDGDGIPPAAPRILPRNR